MQKHRILVIDDTPANLLALGTSLEAEFDLQIATSGVMGLALAESAPPDLILLDIMMPEMDGFETCRRLKAIPRLAHIPVVFVTAIDDMATEATGLSLGAVDYITKPINVEIAKRRIGNLIEREILRKHVMSQRDQLAVQVHELHQSRLELQKGEAYKRTILNSLPSDIVVLDNAGNVCAVNEPWVPLGPDSYVRSVEQPVPVEVGGNYLDAFRNANTSEGQGRPHLPDALQGIRSVLDGTSASFDMEYPRHAPAGDKWFKMVVTPLQSGRQDGIVIAHTDITDRRLSQARLESVLLQQRAMLENDLVGIVRVANRTILWANPAFEKMLGYAPGELVGEPTRRNYPSDAAYADLASAAYPVLEAGGIYHAQIEHVTKSGERIWVELNGAVLDPVTGESLWTFVDISERKRAEKSLRQHLRFGQALNQVAQVIIDGEDQSAILLATASIVGEAMELDRSLIYEVSFTKQVAVGLCEWLNPAPPHLQATVGTYPLEVFDTAAAEIQRAQKHLISHRGKVNPHFSSGEAAEILHGQMGIQSLLWYPFNFQDGACNVLALNQVYSTREWTPQELDFLEAISRQVSIALTKMHLLAQQAKAREKIDLAASVFTHAREGIAITKADGTIIEVNSAFTRITGYGRDEAVGRNPRMLNSGRQGPDFYTNMWQQLADKGHWYGELWNRRKNGDLYAEMLTITTVRDKKGDPGHYVALFTDITALKAHEDKLERVAHYDALTNLPNRVLLADRMKQAMHHAQRRGGQLAVVFIDLDGFKAVNDTYGHALGDQLLIVLSSRMRQALREGDTLARIGGDEFVAVLGDLDDVNTSPPVLNRLLEAASQRVVVGAQPLQVSASLGVTLYPQEQDVEADQLMRQADQAMYLAKLTGKNRYTFFDAEHDSGIRSFHESIDRIRQGLVNSEFALFYQPKVNMLTGVVLGVEALIRWRHPTDGLVAPSLFLPAIENHPLAVEVGEWVINTALDQIEVWQSQGIHAAVSVNVGARQLQQSNFVQRLEAILAEHPRVEPSHLEIEILETSALEDLERVSAVIEDCRKLGVLFAMDDFGTGYSSLTYLRRLRVNLLKIDQSFVRDVLDGVEDLTILQGVIGLAKSFRRSAIAEGVETVGHGTLLLQLGCELAQGYGIAKPMPAEDFPGWLGSWQPDASWKMQSVIASENIPLLYAGIEHRAWVAALAGYLRGERMGPPEMDVHQCSFGMWLDHDGQAGHGSRPITTEIDSLHRHAHALGAEIVNLHAQGATADALQRFRELEDIRDAMVLKLSVLAQSQSAHPV